MADLTIEQLDLQTPIVQDADGAVNAPFVATPYFEDYLFAILTDLTAINDELTDESVTDAENLGTGFGVFAQKDNTILQFKSLIEGNGIEITDDGEELTINSTAAITDGTVANSILTWNAITEEWAELDELTFSWSNGALTMQVENDAGTLTNAMIADPDNGIQFLVDGVTNFTVVDDGALIESDGDIHLEWDSDGVTVMDFFYDSGGDRFAFQLVQVDSEILFWDVSQNLMLQLEDGGAVTGYFDGDATFRSVARGSGGLQAFNTDTGSGWERVLTESDAGGGGGNVADGTVTDSMLVWNGVDTWIELAELTMAWATDTLTIAVNNGTSLVDSVIIDATAGVTLNYAGDAGVVVDSSGIEVHSTTTNPVIRGVDSSDVELGQLQFNNATYGYTLNCIVDEAFMSFLGRDDTSALVQMGQLNPQGPFTWNYAGETVLTGTTQGIQIEHIAAQSVTVLEITASADEQTAINFEEGSQTNAQITWVPSTDEFRFVVETGADFLFENEALQDVLRMDTTAGDVVVELMAEAGVVTAQSQENGINCIGNATNSGGSVRFLNSAQSFQAVIFVDTGTDDVLAIRNGQTSGNLWLQSEDGSGNTIDLLTGNYADGVELFYQDAPVFLAGANGCYIYDHNGDAPNLYFYEDDQNTLVGFLAFNGGSTTELAVLDCEEPGMAFQLRGNDDDDNDNQILWQANFDTTDARGRGGPGAFQAWFIYETGGVYSNFLSLETTNSGIDVHDGTGDNPFIGFYQDDNSTRNGFLMFGSTITQIQNEVNEGEIILRIHDSGGSDTDLVHAAVSGTTGELGFFGVTPVSRPSITTADAASIITALANLGLVTDDT